MSKFNAMSRDYLVEGQCTFSRKYLEAATEQRNYQRYLDKRLSVPKYQRDKVKSTQKIPQLDKSIEHTASKPGKKMSYRNLIHLFSQGIAQKNQLK